MRAAVYSFSLRGAELSKKVGELLHTLGYEVQVETLPKYAEEAKVQVRNVRRDAMEQLKKLEKDGLITEDELKRYNDQVQKLTDKYVGIIDSLVVEKEKEVMTV